MTDSSPGPALPGKKARTRKTLQLAAILVLIAAAGSGGALYHIRYGDRTSTDYNRIVAATKDLIKLQVPPRLWPKLFIERPDVMTMVVYATKNDDACLALVRCVPGLPRDSGNRADQLLQETLAQYFPQFDTERASGVEEREIPFEGGSQKVKISSSVRTEGHQEVRLVHLDDVATEHGALALYFQTAPDSSTDDEIDSLLKSLK
jgi:hypothetical protein